MAEKKNSREKLPLADMHADGTRFDKRTLAALKAKRKLDGKQIKKPTDEN